MIAYTVNVFVSGTEKWRNKDGKLHREGDKPAVIWANGTQVFWKNGKLHRDGDKPARIWASGIQEFFKNGVQYFPDKKHTVVLDGKEVEISDKSFKALKELFGKD